MSYIKIYPLYEVRLYHLVNTLARLYNEKIIKIYAHLPFFIKQPSYEPLKHLDPGTNFPITLGQCGPANPTGQDEDSEMASWHSLLLISIAYPLQPASCVHPNSHSEALLILREQDRCLLRFFKQQPVLVLDVYSTTE